MAHWLTHSLTHWMTHTLSHPLTDSRRLAERLPEGGGKLQREAACCETRRWRTEGTCELAETRRGKTRRKENTETTKQQLRSAKERRSSHFVRSLWRSPSVRRGTRRSSHFVRSLWRSPSVRGGDARGRAAGRLWRVRCAAARPCSECARGVGCRGGVLTL